MTTAYNSTYTTGLGWTPAFKITRNGIDISSNFEDRLISLTVVSIDGGGDGDQCTIVLDDRDFQIASPSTGEDDATTLSIALGYRENALYDCGTFSIHEVVYSGIPRELKITGSSFGYLNNGKSPIITSYDGQTLGDILGSIASSTGATASVDSDLAGIAIPYLNQHESSLHLLQEMERRFNGIAKFQDSMLSFTKRGSGESASGTSIGTFVLKPEDFGSWSILETQRSAFSKVRASYWDKTNHQLQWLNSTVQAATNSTVPFLVTRAFSSQDEAQAGADAKMQSLNTGIRNGTITLAKGDPSIRAGMGFAIAGMRDGIDGSYVIMTATHSSSKDQGLLTTIEFTTPGDGESFGGGRGAADDGTSDT